MNLEQIAGRLAERPDMIVLAQGFTQALERGDFEDAGLWVKDYFEVVAGGFVTFHRDDGGCCALTRTGHLCNYRAMPNAGVCAQHDRLMRQREDA